MSALVILGAGSSFDSVANHSLGVGHNPDLRPPLANQLFDNRPNFAAVLDQIPRMGAIAARLRDRIGRGALLEDELALLEAEAETNPRSAQQLMAVRYYLQRVTGSCGDGWLAQAHGATNLHVLVDALATLSSKIREPVLIVTFNYDTMLEKAIEQELGHRFPEMGSYVSRDDLKVFKLHGSVDWGHHGRAGSNDVSTAPGVIEHAAELEIPTTFEIKRGDWNSGIGGELWVPALAVPVRTKAAFECPPEHLEMLRQLLPTVDRPLVIGWAGMEAHFLAILRERLRVQLGGVVIACSNSPAGRDTWNRVANRPDGTSITIHGRPAATDEDLIFSDLFAHEAFKEFVNRV